LNNIYVATTRAEEELYIFLTDSKNQKNHLIDYIFDLDNIKPYIHGNVIEIGRPSEYNRPVTLEEKPPALLDRTSFQNFGSRIGWLDYIKKRTDTLIKPSVQTISAKTKGDLIHYVLSMVKALPEREEMPFIDCCINAGLARFNSYKDKDGIKHILTGIFKDERFRRFFIHKPGTKVYTEKEVIDKSGIAFKIDRLIIEEKRLMVIDFKTGEARMKEHVNQIRQYMQIIHAIYPERLLEGYLVYIDDGDIEAISI